MRLTCNINSRGKLARLIYGIVLVATGLLLIALWARPTGGILAWIVSVVCALSGAFAIFEAWAGWCVIRAMGFRTPM
jgi:hypothetical protein